mgnify:CR=1 FL=1
MSRKRQLFCKPKAFLSHKALRFALKSLSFSQPKHRSFEQLFTVLKSCLFYVQKAFLLHKPFLADFKNRPFSQTKSLAFAQNLSELPSKATLFCPPLPISTTLNLLSTKEYSCSFNLCSNSLCCKARISHRFKSLPAIPGKMQFSA